jgi:hypothetical protein
VNVYICDLQIFLACEFGGANIKGGGGLLLFTVQPQPHSMSVICCKAITETGSSCECVHFIALTVQPGVCSKCFHHQAYHETAVPTASGGSRDDILRIFRTVSALSTDVGEARNEVVSGFRPSISQPQASKVTLPVFMHNVHANSLFHSQEQGKERNGKRRAKRMC